MLSFTLRYIMHLIVTYPHLGAFIMSTEIDDLDLDLDGGELFYQSEMTEPFFSTFIILRYRVN